MKAVRRLLRRWGDIAVPLALLVIGIGLFASRGLYSWWGPVGAVLAVVVVIQALRSRRR